MNIKEKFFIITKILNDLLCIIGGIIFTIICIFVFIKGNGSLERIFIIPFTICGIAITILGIIQLLKSLNIIKNVKTIVNNNPPSTDKFEQRKEELIKKEEKFKKIYMLGFLMFWFGLLFFICYILLIYKSYITLLMTLPFWIAGIIMIIEKFFKQSKIYVLLSKVKLIITNMFSIIFIVPVILFISGITMLFFGVKNTYRIKDFDTTYGYFNNYYAYKTGENGPEYKLIYNYEVDGNKYYITTDYTTTYIPQKNSIENIKYNPKDPEEALIANSNNYTAMIAFGLCFTFLPLCFILLCLPISNKSFNKILDKYNILPILIGISFVTCGITPIILSDNNLYLFEYILISIFIIFGIYMIIKNIF